MVRPDDGTGGDQVALRGLLREARAIVGERGSCVHLVLWRLRQARPGDEPARAHLAELLVLEPTPAADRTPTPPGPP